MGIDEFHCKDAKREVIISNIRLNPSGLIRRVQGGLSNLVRFDVFCSRFSQTLLPISIVSVMVCGAGSGNPDFFTYTVGTGLSSSTAAYLTVFLVTFSCRISTFIL